MSVEVGGGSADRRSGALCLGTVVVDSAKVIDVYPAIDGLAIVHDVSSSPGGPGANIAFDLRMLDPALPIWFAGAVGDDENGAYLRSEFEQVGIEVCGLQTVEGMATSFTDAMVETGSGRRTFFHHVGANHGFDPASVDIESSTAALFHAGSPGLAHLLDQPVPAHDGDDGDNRGDADNGGHGANGWSELFRRARAAGMHTNMELIDMDPELTRRVAGPCLPHLASVIINEHEAGRLTGIEAPAPDADGPVDWPALESMAHGLIQAGVSTLAVIHVPAGCVAADGAGRTWRQGSVLVPHERICNATGAGDAFAAGVLLGISREWPVEACLRLAVASAAANLTHPGTSAGLKPPADCLSDADRFGYRSTN